MTDIDGLLTRGVANIIPSKDKLAEKLEKGEKLNVYLGIDPTNTKIHLGHAVSLRKLQKFAELGHNVTFLIGDFTALVGDTSDKDSERPALTKEEIEENFKTYKEQAEKILDFSKIKVRHNSEWLSKLTFEELIRLVQKFSAGDFLSRELIKKRLSEGKRVGLHEFLYPVMQGFDSYFMDTDVQIGGADQTFNMQAGRNLQQSERGKESFVLATEYLLGTDGRKMSKTWNNAIWLDDSPTDMFAKIMAINDELITNYYVLATNSPMGEIKGLRENLKDPLNAKKKLAEIIVTELHGPKLSEKAAKEFERVVQKGETPRNISEQRVEPGSVIEEELLLKLGLVESKSDAKRLFSQDGVKLNGEKIKTGEKVSAGILSVGKKSIKLRVD